MLTSTAGRSTIMISPRLTRRVVMVPKPLSGIGTTVYAGGESRGERGGGGMSMNAEEEMRFDMVVVEVMREVPWPARKVDEVKRQSIRGAGSEAFPVAAAQCGG